MIVAILLLAYLLGEIVCRVWDRIYSRWQARVLWAGDTYVHRAASPSEALDWARCYPTDAFVAVEFVFHGHSTITAARGLYAE